MMNLDDSQKDFVNHPASNIRLLAPAGSGKTTTLLYRCRCLLEARPEDKVLIFTFTRVACEELKNRLSTSPDFRCIRDQVAVSTLNAYGNNLLKRKYSGYHLIEKPSRKFILTNDLRPFAKYSPVISEKIDDKKWLNKSANAVMDLLDDMKSLGFDHRKVSKENGFREHCDYLLGIGLDGILDSLFEKMAEIGLIELTSDQPPLHDGGREKVYRQAFRNFAKFYAQATGWLEQQNKFTLEDQKYWGWKVTQDSAKVSGAARYAHIMVDEFQDINPIDLFFLNAIRIRNNSSITVVGDDDQLIFEWRGATPAYILRPGEYLTDGDMPLPFETCILKRNYRSPQNIVECSQRLISQNRLRVEKEIEPVSEQTAQIALETVHSYDDVIRLIEQDLRDESICNVAVVSRKKSHLIPYQIILAGRNEKFFAAEDLNVMLNNAFSILKGLFDIKCRQWDCVPQSPWKATNDTINLFNAMLRYPLKGRSLESVKEYLHRGDPESLLEGIQRLAEKRTGMPKGVNPQDYRSKLMDFACAETVADTIKCIAEHCDGLKKDFRKADDDIFYADPPFQELADFSERYGDDFSGFCEDLDSTITSLSKLISDEEDDLENVMDGISAKLHLMTALRTKGKEFDSVYILNSDNSVWPIKQALEMGRTEAERRLFYVAVTRAKKKLTFVTKNIENISPYLDEMGIRA